MGSSKPVRSFVVVCSKRDLRCQHNGCIFPTGRELSLPCLPPKGSLQELLTLEKKSLRQNGQSSPLGDRVDVVLDLVFFYPISGTRLSAPGSRPERVRRRSRASPAGRVHFCLEWIYSWIDTSFGYEILYDSRLSENTETLDTLRISAVGHLLVIHIAIPTEFMEYYYYNITSKRKAISELVITLGTFWDDDNFMDIRGEDVTPRSAALPRPLSALSNYENLRIDSSRDLLHAEEEGSLEEVGTGGVRGKFNKE
ncbi:unnamed protein product [Nezara viridula]|uniref:Uncharacterized protein n=1 Tax=Nezara viridula TaxID=85310 RepID=A0A9P0HSB7_NEZVI|nr:unnamed protein product [Nezara viridula]